MFIDRNENGSFDSGDGALAGTTVYLTDSGDTYVIGTATTDGSGGYSFAGLGEGSYRVKHPVPSGWFRTTDDSVPFSVPPDFGHDFGVAQPPQPTVELYATNYTPALNSGPVQVWAEFSPPQAAIETINWEGCTPDQQYNTVCYVETTTPGDRTVAMSAYVAGWWLTDSLVIAVQQPPQLRLFLDADNNFNPANPVNDRPNYVPGSNLAGVSVSLPQTTTLIAAFVNASGQIVAPPAGITSVAFFLDDTSRFVGIAMNSGTDTGPDFTLAAPTADFLGDWTARVGLLAHDYGGFTRVSASAGTFSDTINSIPRDPNGNMIPDGGWVTWNGTAVQDGNAGEDIDGTPAVSGPPAGLGLVGDGFVRFEEYRGFMVRGVHRRTNPAVKDLFVSSKVESGPVRFELGFFPTAGSGIAAHWVLGLDESPTPDYFLDPGGDPARHLIVNFNTSNSGFGGQIPGHTDQRGLRVMMEGGTPGILGDTVNLATKPCLLSAGGTGGGSPNEIFPHIRIFLAEHQNRGNQAQPPNSQAQIDNEVRRTIAHEIAHGIHVKHRNSPSTCDDGANVGPGPSVMDSNWYSGPPDSDPRSQFNADDIAQIRLHLRP